MKVETFGYDSELAYTDRDAVYALIERESRIAVVKGRSGEYFLPGGGIETGECAESAIKREIMEECGMEAEVVSKLWGAVQYFTAKSEGINFRSEMLFYSCRLITGKIAESEHDLIWLDFADTSTSFGFFHEAHLWAVRVNGSG